jgi:hypothetical protein
MINELKGLSTQWKAKADGQQFAGSDQTFPTGTRNICCGQDLFLTTMA